MLRCEQYPSIHGERYREPGSIRVFVISQSRVPGRSFSRCTRVDTVVDVPRSRVCTHPDRDTAAPSGSVTFSQSRREKYRSLQLNGASFGMDNGTFSAL